MDKLIGGLKIGIAVVLVIGVIVSIYLFLKEGIGDSPIVGGIGALLSVGIVGFMLHYLYKTAVWNLKELEYKWSLPILLGMCFYFLGVCYFIYFPFSAGATSFISSTLIFGVLALFIVVSDLSKLLKKRKE